MKQQFSLNIKQLFPKYVDHSNYDVFNGVNEAIDILVRKRLVRAKIDKANVCSKVSLNVDLLDEAYKYIHRTKKTEINNSIINILNQYKDKNEVLNHYCLVQLERISANKSVQFFNGDFKEFDNILFAIENLFKINIETYIRDFSIRLFNDSKVFERISNKVVNLLVEYGDFPEKNQVLKTLNLIKNPTYVNFKGAGLIVLAGQKINLSTLESDIAISSAMINDIEKIEVSGKAVMTVENLTSFNRFKNLDIFLIYLGGYHNKVRRDFIKKVHEQNQDKLYYHFGDIDAGGFYILEHLRRLTAVNFIPYKMDVATLEQHIQYSKKLTENDKVRLKALQGSMFDDVITYMLKNNCKLEQEAIEFDY